MVVNLKKGQLFMTNQEIINFTINFLSDYGLDPEDVEIDNSQLQIGAALDSLDLFFSIDVSGTIDQQILNDRLNQQLHQAIDDYDLEDEMQQFGLNPDQLDLINNLNDSYDQLKGIDRHVQNEIHNIHQTDFQEELADQIRTEASILQDDGYDLLPLMQNYSDAIYALAHCEPIYRALEKTVDQSDSATHTAMAPVNFFNSIENEGPRIISQFNENPEETINNYIKKHQLKKKN